MYLHPHHPHHTHPFFGGGRERHAGGLIEIGCDEKEMGVLQVRLPSKLLPDIIYVKQNG
jgi:hypothetical protein